MYSKLYSNGSTDYRKWIETFMRLQTVKTDVPDDLGNLKLSSKLVNNRLLVNPTGILPSGCCDKIPFTTARHLREELIKALEKGGYRLKEGASFDSLPDLDSLYVEKDNGQKIKVTRLLDKWVEDNSCKAYDQYQYSVWKNNYCRLFVERALDYSYEVRWDARAFDALGGNVADKGSCFRPDGAHGQAPVILYSDIGGLRPSFTMWLKANDKIVARCWAIVLPQTGAIFVTNYYGNTPGGVLDFWPVVQRATEREYMPCYSMVAAVTVVYRNSDGITILPVELANLAGYKKKVAEEADAALTTKTTECLVCFKNNTYVSRVPVCGYCVSLTPGPCRNCGVYSLNGSFLNGFYYFCSPCYVAVGTKCDGCGRTPSTINRCLVCRKYYRICESCCSLSYEKPCALCKDAVKEDKVLSAPQ
jgi:hypothetical protein